VSSLPIELDRSLDEPLYRQIERQIRVRVEEGMLAGGVRLPGVRTLARQLGVARITVVGAYEQLVAEGYLIGRVGLGTIVAVPSADRLTATTSPIRSVPRPRARLAGAVPVAVPRRPIRFDFRPGVVDRELMVDGPWERRLAQAWRDLSESPSRRTERAEPFGERRLRELIAAYLGAARAVRATAEDVLVLPDRRSIYALLGRLVARPRMVCALEDPSDPAIARAFAASGAQIRHVPVDGQGLRTELLPTDARLVAVTPAWQYPRGGTLPAERRAALLDWAERNRAIVVEDDRDGHLRYEGPLPPALQSLDRTGRVVHVGSFGRLALPGLGLAYAVIPARLAAQARERMAAEGLHASRLEQWALAGVLADGQVDRQLRRLRKVLAERQAALVAAVASEAGDLLSVDPAPAGRHLLATIRTGAWDGSRLSFRAREAGVAITPLARYRAGPGPDRGILLGYAAHRPEVILEGVTQLRRVARLAERLSGPVGLAASGGRPAASP
jgi:GntR family transcriptional regulator/MocR family aminotransferase